MGVLIVCRHFASDHVDGTTMVTWWLFVSIAMVMQSTKNKKMSKDTTTVTWWISFNGKYIWLQWTTTKQKNTNRNHNFRLFWWDLESGLWIHIIWIGNNNNINHIQGTTIITFSEAFLLMTEATTSTGENTQQQKNIDYLSKVSSTLCSSVEYRGTIAENLLQESNGNVLKIQAMGTSVLIVVMSKIIRKTVDLMAETLSFQKVCG